MNKISKYLITAALFTTPIIAFGFNNNENNNQGISNYADEAVRIEDGTFTAAIEESMPWRMDVAFQYTDSSDIGIDSSQEVVVNYSVLENGEVVSEEVASSVPEGEETLLLLTNVESENPLVTIDLVLPSQEISIDSISYTNSLGEADSNTIDIDTTSAVQTILPTSYYLDLGGVNENGGNDFYLNFDVKYDVFLDSMLEEYGYDYAYPIDFDQAIRLDTDHGILTPNMENESGLKISINEDSFHSPVAPYGMVIQGLGSGEVLNLNSFTYTDEMGNVHVDSLEGLSTESLTVDWDQQVLDTLSMGAIDESTLGLSFEYNSQVDNIIVQLKSENGDYYSNEVIDGSTINEVEIVETGKNTTNIIEIKGLEEDVEYQLTNLEFDGSSITQSEIQSLNLKAAPTKNSTWEPGDKNDEGGMLWLIILAVVIVVILAITIPVTIYLVKR